MNESFMFTVDFPTILINDFCDLYLKCKPQFYEDSTRTLNRSGHSGVSCNSKGMI